MTLLNHLIWIVKYLLCSHSRRRFLRNIYGDEIIWVSPINKTYRSWWVCKNCGGLIGDENLYENK